MYNDLLNLRMGLICKFGESLQLALKKETHFVAFLVGLDPDFCLLAQESRPKMLFKRTWSDQHTEHLL